MSSWEGFKQGYLKEFISLSPSLSAAARVHWSCLFLGDGSLYVIINLTLSCRCRNALCFRNVESQPLNHAGLLSRRWGGGVQTLIRSLGPDLRLHSV